MHGWRRVTSGASCISPKGPGCFPYVLLITGYFPTLVAVDHTTLLLLGDLVFRFNQQLSLDDVPLEMCVDTIFPKDLLKALPYSLGIWDDYVSNAGFFLGEPSFCIFAGAVGALCWAAFLVTVIVTIILLVAIKIFTLNFMYGPPGIFALDQSLP